MWKTKVARLVQVPMIQVAMSTIVKLVVPRQRVGVAVVAVNESEEVFLLRHVYHPHWEWGLPGGWLKRNEAPAAGALRELREETGLTAVLGPAVTVQHNLTPPHIGIAYLAQINGGEPQLSHEIIEARWFPHDALPVPLSKHTRLAIAAAVQTYRQVG